MEGSGMCLRKQKTGLCEPLIDSPLPGWPSTAALQGHMAEGSSTLWRGGSLNERGGEYSQEAVRLVVEEIIRVKSSFLQGSGERERARMRVSGRRMREPGPLWWSSQHELLQQLCLRPRLEATSMDGGCGWRVEREAKLLQPR